MKTLVLLIIFYLFVSNAHSQIIQKKCDSLIYLMSFEQKIDQLNRNSFMTTKNEPTLNLTGFNMSDGPHGYGKSTSTCFPVSISLAASFDKKLWNEVGTAIGEEFQASNTNVMLGPCLDICRDSRNGRSSETIGEDAYLGSIYGEYFVKGVQNAPVIATIKHFTGTNRENNRYNMNVLISKEQLMSYHGINFKRAIQEGGAMAVMSSYNLINWIRVSENKLLLDTILRQKWGFPFLVMSDWGGIKNTRNSILAKNDLCMGNDRYKSDIPYLISSDSLKETDLNDPIINILKTKIFAGFTNHFPRNNNAQINSTSHQQLALKAAQKSIVLLKNENAILPLSKKNNTIGLIGPSAAVAQLNGYGSSMVTPPYAISPLQGIQHKIDLSNLLYTKGCDIYSNDTSYFQEAREIAKKVNTVIFVGGLDETMEGEGYGIGGDRKNNSVELPATQQKLISELAKVNPNIIVILKSGGVCAVPQCIQNIKGFIYAFYPGMEGGNALADILFGDINPSGKMPVTMPKNNTQMPKWNDNFNDDYNSGYFYCDQLKLKPEFAFGFGLSYTTFKISNLKTSKNEYALGETLHFEVDVMNTGTKSGEEVVQLYCSNKNKKSWSPVKELKGFEKVMLQPNETKTIHFTLSNEELYVYNESKDEYTVLAGLYEIAIGNASDSLPLKTTIKITETKPLPDLKILHIYTVPRYPIQGEKIHFLATIKNAGNTESPSNTSPNIVLKVNNETIAKASINIPSIPAGGMKLIEINDLEGGTNYFQSITTGILNIEAQINENQHVIESEYTNNFFSRSLKIYDLDSVTKFDPLISKKEVILYPNPANEILNIHTPTLEKFEVTILNLNGQFVSHEDFYNTMYEINIKNLETGLYLLKINSQSHQEILRFIKL